MEIEYKRELTKSYMCVKTDQDFLPFEKEILTRNSISGILPVNTTFADAATVCWYDITGMQAFDHALETEMMDSQMLTQFLVSLCGTLERLESFLLDPGHLWFSRESIFKQPGWKFLVLLLPGREGEYYRGISKTHGISSHKNRS